MLISVKQREGSFSYYICPIVFFRTTNISSQMKGNEQKEDGEHIPKPALAIFDVMMLIIGIVIGAGIFRSPQVVAVNSPNEFFFLGIWIAGGIISLIGALCYAELSAAFPSTGGDYHFLKLAFGKRFSFLYAWARIVVIQTGSIAMLAYIAGDYLSRLLFLGTFSSALYAASIIIMITLINVLGIRFGTGTQKLLTILQMTGILLLIVAGFFAEPSLANTGVEKTLTDSAPLQPSISLAVIFVLLTYGGWNEAAFVSSELKLGSGKMTRGLIVSLLLITGTYFLINLAFLNVLGLEGVGASEAVGMKMMQQLTGEKGAVLIGLLITLSAITSLNTTVFTGARSSYALGKDFSPLSFLGKWNGKKSAPVNSLLLQGAIALLLVFFGVTMPDGFEAMVNFTAPIFWFFFLSTGISLLVLRVKEKNVTRPFKVPLYPVLPILFIVSCLYMLHASLAVTGLGAFLGAGLLLVGCLVTFAAGNQRTK